MRRDGFNQKKTGLPPVLLIFLTFIALICIGTTLLMLPISNKSGLALGFVNSLFTATSAVCVTGLVVVDTFTNFTFFGQLIILILIQCGGLGLMTIATLVFIFIGKRITLKDRLVLQEVYADSNLTGLLTLTQKIVKLTVAIEFVGAFLLSLYFIPNYGYIDGIWMSIFHAVSAFCNAGFDILGGGVSLAGVSSVPIVMLTISFLVVLGGLGFGVIIDCIRVSKGETSRLQQNTKIVLMLTGGLLAVGFVGFFIFEFSNAGTIGDMNFIDKIINSFALSVMPRTAGFSSVDLAETTFLSQALTEFLMFIGASPASTGGGIKTTTFLVLLLTFIAGSRGEDEVLIGGKTVTHEICFKAVAITILAVLIIAIVSTVVFAIEQAVGNTVATYRDVVFEVISAFSTVGLSMGITSTLSNASLLIVAGVMLVGRLGTLCLSLIFLVGSKPNAKIKHPNAKIIIG